MVKLTRDLLLVGGHAPQKEEDLTCCCKEVVHVLFLARAAFAMWTPRQLLPVSLDQSSGDVVVRIQ